MCNHCPRCPDRSQYSLASNLSLPSPVPFDADSDIVNDINGPESPETYQVFYRLVFGTQSEKKKLLDIIATVMEYHLTYSTQVVISFFVYATLTFLLAFYTYLFTDSVVPSDL
ncbi:uncharacterized protein N7496_004726 [Penicillium cataractarum]|uniref:Uncharacterized protein n=1 Tax=Penicillium cataractarum TaxID=2100454 RepID=A0A9W9SEU3_9EURO|nr:uncharacterized protein N7496_004726 [Penicillium cataractarum]KAJ5377317.1 hypothetical protein N7496_004726 [Penicillium cataractarum]